MKFENAEIMDIAVQPLIDFEKNFKESSTVRVYYIWKREIDETNLTI